MLGKDTRLPQPREEGMHPKEDVKLRDIIKSRDVQVKELKTEIDEMKAILDDHLYNN